jgi:hypothetical protein
VNPIEGACMAAELGLHCAGSQAQRAGEHFRLHLPIGAQSSSRTKGLLDNFLLYVLKIKQNKFH